MGLSREVLRWILSLDLSLSVRNPRRDFANGYLVAEILSKYWDDVSMHSYVNATSTAEKRSNWDLLTKFFSVHGINLTKDTVDAIVSQQQAPVEKFLQQLYLFIMERSPSQGSIDRIHPPASSMLPASSSCTSRRSSVASSHCPWSSGVVPDEPPVPEVPSRSATQIHAMMQQQLAQMAPLQQQGIIANVMAQRAVFVQVGGHTDLLPTHEIVQALMAGKNPEEAMAAAVEHIPHSPQLQRGHNVTDNADSIQNQHINPNVSLPGGQHVAQNRPHAAGRLGSGGGQGAMDRDSSTYQGQVHAQGRVRGEESCPPKAHSQSSGQHRTRSSQGHAQAQHSPAEHATRAINDWKESANNPKAETYRYWELGSLGPAETEELRAKRLAALRAKEYGIRVAEMAKTSLKPKAKHDLARAQSNRDRAMEFARTVRAPKRVSKPDAPALAPPRVVEGTQRGRTKRGPSVTRGQAASDLPCPTLQHQLSVNTMVARHMDAAKRVADIKAEVQRWDLEDRQLPAVPHMPKRRSPSPPQSPSRPQPRSKSPGRKKPAGRTTHPQGETGASDTRAGTLADAGVELASEQAAGEEQSMAAEEASAAPEQDRVAERQAEQEAQSEDGSNT